MSGKLPERSSVVIIGGGVIGVSTAFHLAEAGVRDVLLLDRGPLGSGSTCKAAGGVRAMFSDRVNIELGKRSLEAFTRFGERPGQEIDLHQVGYLFLLERPEHVRAMTEAVELQNELGVPSRMISPAEARQLSPLISTEHLLAAAWSPTDGHCTPESVVLGYATAARRHGLADVGLHSGWAGLYEMTPDHNALIGEADHVARLLYATGFSGHGFLMGPAVGEVMRDLVLRWQPPVDVTSLSVDRLLANDLRPETHVV